ncbi:transposase family protein [Pseudonocardia sp. 73-21]|uniref:transposase family protein n=1 Tax=Pseudonocardia sp. 73-21 TaxID=1895809 RepID=UPI0026144873|nr:transposase family protein [Pseudonocardia sp. 73-21]
MRRNLDQHEGRTINAWYSGKHRAPGGNVQAIMRPDGLPIWVSDVLPGHRHDLTCARTTGVLGALYWSASQLDLPTLADSGYHGAGQGVHTRSSSPATARSSPLATRPTTHSLRSVRCRGERGFALLTGRWRALRRVTASPRRIGDYVKAALVLMHIEQVQLRNSR